MAEETLNTTLQNKILIFFKKNSKKLVIFSVLFILVLFSYFLYKDLIKKKEIQLSQDYVKASIQFDEKKIDEAKIILENIVNKNHKFYSPLALYFIIDNNLENDSLKIIKFFDKILLISSIDKENLNLIKIKKAMFLFNTGDEEDLIKTLNPIINSKSVWRNLAINVISDYFLSTNQKKKANEYIQLIDNKIKK
jgi:predicted negative regulator of RcsB-dependent stress response